VIIEIAEESSTADLERPPVKVPPWTTLHVESKLFGNFEPLIDDVSQFIRPVQRIKVPFPRFLFRGGGKFVVLVKRDLLLGRHFRFSFCHGRSIPSPRDPIAASALLGK